MPSVSISFGEAIDTALDGKADLVNGKVPLDQLPALEVDQAAIDQAIANHEQAIDPHPGYVNAVELGTAIANHEQAIDPHPGYATDAELTSAIASKAAQSDLTAAIARIGFDFVGTFAQVQAAHPSPSQGFRWKELDSSGYFVMDWFWRSPYWLSNQVTALSYGFTGLSTSSGNFDNAFTVFRGYGLFFEEFQLAFNSIGSTNWKTFAFQIPTGTTIATLSTQGISGRIALSTTVSTAFFLGASSYPLRVVLGNPGNTGSVTLNGVAAMIARFIRN
jgi:hypothetical protein